MLLHATYIVINVLSAMVWRIQLAGSGHLKYGSVLLFGYGEADSELSMGDLLWHRGSGTGERKSCIVEDITERWLSFCNEDLHGHP
jgi:hypothetical protein